MFNCKILKKSLGMVVTQYLYTSTKPKMFIRVRDKYSKLYKVHIDAD